MIKRLLSWFGVWRRMFRAFQNRNFRFYFTGQFISMLGSWLQQIALGWLIYEKTRSPFLLGAVSFLSNIPILILGPFVGVWLDRVDRRRALETAQWLGLIQATFLAILAWTDWLTVPLVIIMALLQGLANSIDMPSRQALIFDIAGKDDLPNAIALNSMLFNLARLVGPATAGFFLAIAGAKVCFILNAISYLPMVIALRLIHVSPQTALQKTKDWWLELEEGAKYVMNSRVIRNLLFWISCSSLLASPVDCLLPVFAKDILKGDAHTMAMLSSSLGFGALLGAILLSLRQEMKAIGFHIAGAALGFGVGLFIYARSIWLPLSMLGLILVGISMIIQYASCNILLQTITSSSRRGRVMSFYSMSVMGMLPIGALAAGSLAGHLGAVPVMGLVAAGYMWIAWNFYRLAPQIRHACEVAEEK